MCICLAVIIMSLVVKRADCAAVLGVSVRRLAQLEAEGIIKPSRRGTGGRASLFDLHVVGPKYIAHLESVTAGDGQTAEAERAALTRVRRQQLELELAQQQGMLISFDDVVRAFRAIGRGASSQVRQIPLRARAEGLVDASGEARLKRMCHEILEGISRWKTVEDAVTR